MKTKTKTLHIAYTDGACVPNPGPGASAYLFYLDDEEILRGGEYYPREITNNIAELQAILQAIQVARRFNYLPLEIRSDSSWSVNAMNRSWKVKVPHCADLVSKIRTELSHFDPIRLVWVPRDQNTLADALSKEIFRDRESLSWDF